MTLNRAPALCYPTNLQVEKAEKREETVAVAVVQLLPPGAARGDTAASCFLLVQRPPSGLLAGLWQFPLLQLPEGGEEGPRRQQQLMDDYLESQLGVRLVPAAAKGAKADGAGGSWSWQAVGVGMQESGTLQGSAVVAGPAFHSPAQPTNAAALPEGQLAVVERRPLGQLVHVFSHIRMTMQVGACGWADGACCGWGEEGVVGGRMLVHAVMRRCMCRSTFSRSPHSLTRWPCPPTQVERGWCCMVSSGTEPRRHPPHLLPNRLPSLLPPHFNCRWSAWCCRVSWTPRSGLQTMQRARRRCSGCLQGSWAARGSAAA